MAETRNGGKRVRCFMAAQFSIPAGLLLAKWISGTEVLYGWGWQMFS